MRSVIVFVALIIGTAPTAEAQEATVDCTPGSMSADYGGALSRNGISLITPPGDHAVSDSVRNGAIGKWTDAENGCSESQRPPLFNGAVADGNVETWTVRQGRQADFPEIRVSASVCGIAPLGTSRTIYIFTDYPCTAKEWRQIEYLAHELGHAMRLGHTNGASECEDHLMFPRMDLDTKADRKNPHPDECTALKREKDRDRGGDRGGDGDDPGDPGGDDEVDCATEPWRPECRQTLVVCRTECTEVDGGSVCDVVCTEYAFSPGTSGGGSTIQTGVGSRSYTIKLSAEASVNVTLTGMDRDVNCRVGSSSCTNLAGTLDDSWSGTLAEGEHTLTVYPHLGGTGSYTLTVTATSTATPPLPPPPLTVPAVPDSRSPSGGSFDTVLPAATGGTSPYVYSVSGLPAGITFVASTRRASGTLPTVTTDTDYTITYAATDSASASSSATFVVTVVAPTAPSAPTLSGSVSGRTQTLTWTAPPGGGITRYQLQTRVSAAHRWRFTGAGVPSPSSNIGSSVRSWSVVTPWTLVRHYRVRATNAVGDGAWSNVVELTTPPAPPPPLSVPGIPDFRLASGRSVNTVFPAATGGTAPYVYSVSGLPPGITFVASTRRASGRLPTVTTETDYTITYTATDSASASDSVSFVATVVPPPPPPPPPSAPQLSGSVVRQTQSLSWTAPASTSPITRYQMQTRNSAAHSWRYTRAGSPSPSSNFSSSARSWSVTTPPGLYRHYRVRATSANGDGAWSNVVELTSN